MRRVLLSVLVGGLVSGASWATPADDVRAGQEALRARSQAVAAAEAARDVEAAVAFYAEDAVVHLEGAPQIEGQEAIGEMYRQWFSGLKEFSGTTSHLALSHSGDLAYEYGINHMVTAGPEGDLPGVGKYLVVWKKVDGEWRIAALSVTTDPPPAPAGGER